MFESLIKSNRWAHEVKCALVLFVLFVSQPREIDTLVTVISL